MPWIICEPCVGVKDQACVEVCPVDCIYEAPEGEKDTLYIQPEECIDCGACEPVCPVEAIFMEEEVPEKWNEWIGINYQLSGLDPPG